MIGTGDSPNACLLLSIHVAPCRGRASKQKVVDSTLGYGPPSLPREMLRSSEQPSAATRPEATSLMQEISFLGWKNPLLLLFSL